VPANSDNVSVALQHIDKLHDSQIRFWALANRIILSQTDLSIVLLSLSEDRPRSSVNSTLEVAFIVSRWHQVRNPG